jgi:GAF domain-containing protein
MDDLKQSELLTQPLESSSATTRELPRVLPGQKKEEDFRAGQGRILEMIAANAPLSEILKSLVLLIEAQSEVMLCSVLLLSDDGNHIRHGAAPSLPEDYVKAIDGAPIGPKHGSCGTAMFRGQRVIVTDILSDPLWEDYRDLASAAGLRACWSTPIMSGRGKVLGSFAMYYREPRTPTGDEAGLTEVATRIAGLAIEHQSAREALARTQGELARCTQTATMGEFAAAIAPEVNHQLEAIVNNADTCLQLLVEGKPDVARLREALIKIAADGRRALEVIARIRALQNRER